MSRKLVLGVIVGVLVLIGGAVGVVVLMNQGKGGSASVVTEVDGTKITTTDNYKDNFLLYANYVLTGVASTEALPEGYDVNRDYYIWKVYDDQNKEALNIAGGYLENFESAYKTEGLSDATGVIATYMNNFDIVKETLVGEPEGDSNEEISDYYDRERTAQIRIVEDIWNVWRAINE